MTERRPAGPTSAYAMPGRYADLGEGEVLRPPHDPATGGLRALVGANQE